MTTMDAVMQAGPVETGDQTEPVVDTEFAARQQQFYDEAGVIGSLLDAQLIPIPLKPDDVTSRVTPEPFAVLRLNASGDREIIVRERRVIDVNAIGHKVILSFSQTEDGIEAKRQSAIFDMRPGGRTGEHRQRAEDLRRSDRIVLNLVFAAVHSRKEELEAAAAKAAAAAQAAQTATTPMVEAA